MFILACNEWISSLYQNCMMCVYLWTRFLMYVCTRPKHGIIIIMRLREMDLLCYFSAATFLIEYVFQGIYNATWLEEYMEAEVDNLRAMPKQRVGNLTQDIKSHIGQVCQHDTFSKCIHVDSQPTPDFSMESISEILQKYRHARTHIMTGLTIGFQISCV